MLKCQSCGSNDVESFLDLGDQPICNRFSREAMNHQRYPLRVAFCQRCHLVQLVDYPSPEEIWSPSYTYLTGATPEAQDYFDLMAYQLTKRYHLNSNSRVVDIGGNDGTFLKYVRKHSGAKVLNVEPSEAPRKASLENNIDTFSGRFEDVSMPRVVEANPDLITAFNVLAHVETIHDLLRKVASFDCPFVAQNHYLLRLMEWNQYDTFYHEHLRYYSFQTFRGLLEMHGLGVQDTDESEYYGGSFIVHANLGDSAPFFWKEKIEKGLNQIRTYSAWSRKVQNHRRKLRRLLERIEEPVIGAGAPMKCSTLINYCGIADRISCIVERNPLKIGTYVPGTKIPVVSYEEGLKKNRGYVLILAWNAVRSIISIMNSMGYTGRFIVPIPEPMII